MKVYVTKLASFIAPPLCFPIPLCSHFLHKAALPRLPHIQSPPISIYKSRSLNLDTL